MLLLALALVACKKKPPVDGEKPSEEKVAEEKAAATEAPDEELPTPPPAAATGPRYLRPNHGGTLVDAFKFPSVPASIIEQQVAGSSTKAGAAAILRRFGLTALGGGTGHFWMAKASLVDRLARERLLVVAFHGEPNGEGVRDEDGWIVFLGSTSDDRVLKIGAVRITSKTTVDAPVEVDAHDLHSRDVDDVVATWSSCVKAGQKACHSMRAWTMQRGYPELILDVAGESKPVVSAGIFPPHDVVVDGRTWKFDDKAFAYR